MSDYLFADDEFCSIDVLTGNVVFKLPSPIISFENPDHFEAWLHERADMLPLLRAAHKAIMERSVAPSASEDDSPLVEKCNWVVTLTKLSLSHKETVQTIMKLTGWSFHTANIEVQAGTPITLGAGLTMVEAVRLQKDCEDISMDVEVKAISEH